MSDNDADPKPPYAKSADDVVGALGTDGVAGLSGSEAAERLARYG